MEGLLMGKQFSEKDRGKVGGSVGRDKRVAKGQAIRGKYTMHNTEGGGFVDKKKAKAQDAIHKANQGISGIAKKLGDKPKPKSMGSPGKIHPGAGMFPVMSKGEPKGASDVSLGSMNDSFRDKLAPAYNSIMPQPLEHEAGGGWGVNYGEAAEAASAPILNSAFSGIMKGLSGQAASRATPELERVVQRLIGPGPQVRTAGPIGSTSRIPHTAPQQATANVYTGTSHATGPVPASAYGHPGGDFGFDPVAEMAEHNYGRYLGHNNSEFDELGNSYDQARSMNDIPGAPGWYQ